ncbi:MAG TPA: hypothetical protein VH639_00660 [Bryobacteraceae bacterium]
MKFTTIAGVACLVCAVGSAQEPPTPPSPVPQGNPGQILPKPENTPTDDIDNVPFSFQPFFWLSSGRFNMKTGAQAANAAAQALANFGTPVGTLPDSSLPTLGNLNKHTPGGMITFPAGKYNRLEVSFFQAQGNGTSTAPQDLTFFGQNIPSGDFLSSSFRVRNISATWNYLTWPDPPETAKFRLRTLWGFQITQVQSVIDAPYETSLSFTPAVGTHNIYYPNIGVEGEWVPTKRFYIDARVSGFAFPHRSAIWDAQATANVRFGNAELYIGGKAYHLKTSPQQEEYIDGTLQGAMVGVRYVFR